MLSRQDFEVVEKRYYKMELIMEYATEFDDIDDLFLECEAIGNLLDKEIADIADIIDADDCPMDVWHELLSAGWVRWKMLERLTDFKATLASLK